MILKVESYLKNAKHSLGYWKAKKANPKNDGSIPDSCYYALIEHKINVFNDVISYLESLPKDTILTTDRGRTEEGVKYFDIVNK